MGPMRRLAVRRAVLAVVVLGSVLAWPAPARAASFAQRFRSQPLPGVQVEGLRSGALSLDVGRVARGAPVRIEVVTAGPVGGGVETTSGVCRRVGGILCVNGDFAACRTCSTAFGGIVHDNVLQRSPVGGHAQLTLGPAGPAAGDLGWGGSLEATLTYVTTPPPVLGGLLPSGPPVERRETVRLGLDAVNRARGANQVVLYTPPFGPTTSTRGGDEAELGGGAAALGTDLGVSLRSLGQNVGSSRIPGDGMIVSAEGAGSSRLKDFWARANDRAAASRSVVLRTSVNRPAEESVGGHPVILAGGRTVGAGSTDPFAIGRNPRTLVGWNPAGELLLATVDGRQPGHSIGVGLIEAADLLRQLGATDGFNLDGGGSSTMVSLAPGGGRTPRVLNRPSDGSERRVSTVLAVVPLDGGAVRTSGATGSLAPPPPPAPPGPPPVDEASTDGLPAKRRPVPPPTTTAPPTTLPPTTTTVPQPPPDTAPPEVADINVAAPLPAPLPDGSSRSSTGVPAGIAAAALLAASVATVRVARTRRLRPPGAPPPA